MKLQLSTNIYALIEAMCYENHQSQLYIFTKIHYFQHHLKYMDAAMNCIILIVNSNMELLT